MTEPLDTGLIERGEFFRLSYGHRLSQSLYNANTVLVTPRWLALQGGLQWLAPEVFAQISGQLASDRYAAASGTLRWQTRWGSWAAEWYRADSAVDGGEDESDPLRRSTEDMESWSLRYLLVSPQNILSAGVQYLDGDSEESYSFGLRWDRHLLAGQLRLSTMLQYDRLQRAAAGVEVRWSASAESGLAWVSAGNGEGDRFPERYGLGAMGQHWFDSGAGFNFNLRGESVDHRRLGFAQLDYQSEQWRGSLDWADEWSERRSRSGSLTLSTNMLLGAGGAEFFTGGSVRSGLYVKVEGKPGYPVELVINDRRRIRLMTGQRKFIPLPHYRVYDLYLQTTKASPLDFPAARRRVVLYPGSVPFLRWQASTIVAVYGQLSAPGVDDGETLEVRSAMSRDRIENGGFFALDAASDERVLEVYRQGQRLCELNLPERVATEEVIDMGLLSCAEGGA